MITVFGLDLSLTSTGISGNDTTTCISTNKKGAERLHIMSEEILGVVRQAENPAVVVEGYSFSSRNSQAHSIGELGGVVRVSLWRAGIPFTEVAPTARAKFATGKGNSSKAEVLSAVSARTGIVWSGSGADDMCDAWILEEMGRCLMGTERFQWPSGNRLALDKVDWSVVEERYGT